MTNPAATYESYMVPSLFGPWAKRLVDVAQPVAGELVLDVGTGTGVVARELAGRVLPGGSVAGIDISPDMLAIARQVSEGAHPPITWYEGRAEALPFADASFDLVTCQYAAMFFSDRPRALAEMRRVLRDGGRLALSVWQGMDRHPFYATLHRVIERRLGMSGVQDIFVLGDEAEVRRLLGDAGFRTVSLQTQSECARFPGPRDFLAGEIDVDTAAIPSMQQLDAGERRRIVETIAVEMGDPLAEVTRGDEVVLPFHAYIFTAER